MTEKIYLALYKGTTTKRGFSAWLSRLEDKLIRRLTRGKYSHCEIAVELDIVYIQKQYECYSSSPRDGGVRKKLMKLPSTKWDLIEIDQSILNQQQLQQFYEITKGLKYDMLGAFGLIFANNQHGNKYFCSEWCAKALGLDEAWRFSPNDLAVIVRRIT